MNRVNAPIGHIRIVGDIKFPPTRSVCFDLLPAFGPGGLADCLNAPLVSDLGIMEEGRRYGVRTR
jgi:hypothetical protein